MPPVECRSRPETQSLPYSRIRFRHRSVCPMLSPAITGKLPPTVDEMAIVLARASTSLPKAHCDNAKTQHMVGADRSGRRRISVRSAYSRGVNFRQPSIHGYEIIDIFGFVLPNWARYCPRTTTALCIERSNCKLPSRKGSPLITVKRFELTSVI